LPRLGTDDVRRVRARRAAAQLLSGPGGSTPARIVERLLAVQAQDLRAARLALRARGKRLTAADVDRALSVERSLAVGWLCRGTLHLVGRENYLWLLALTAPLQAARSRRRLGQEGVSADAADSAVAVIAEALAAEGPLGRPELAERMAARGIRTEGQATPLLLNLAAIRGVAVLGPVRDGRQLFALARDWLGAARPPVLVGDERAAALAELARRYLAGHGPATAADLAGWVGLPLRDARAGLRAIGGELVELGGELVELAGRTRTPGRLPARLLPAFDPYLLGWKDRSFGVPPEHARRVHPGGGIVRATATVDGVAAGTWSARRRGDRVRVEVEPFAALAPGAARALRAEARDVERFESLR
jgi:Winged helix DNA-binding domain